MNMSQINTQIPDDADETGVSLDVLQLLSAEADALCIRL